jgi:plasmid stabilization system protein ParE
MVKRIIWSPASEKDFNEITEYLHKNWGEQITLDFID